MGILNTFRRANSDHNNHSWIKNIQKKLNSILKEARGRHGKIIERNFISMYSRKLWDSIKMAANITKKKMSFLIEKPYRAY